MRKTLTKKQKLELELMDIELILLEASAIGLRDEVQIDAQKYINKVTTPVEAYQMAYNDWTGE